MCFCTPHSLVVHPSMRSRDAERVELNLREHFDLGMAGRKGPRRIRERSLEGKREIRNIQSDADETGRKANSESHGQWRSEEREAQKEAFGAEV